VVAPSAERRRLGQAEQAPESQQFESKPVQVQEVTGLGGEEGVELKSWRKNVEANERRNTYKVSFCPNGRRSGSAKASDNAMNCRVISCDSPGLGFNFQAGECPCGACFVHWKDTLLEFVGQSKAEMRRLLCR
jgi:hypothetical protein